MANYRIVKPDIRPEDVDPDERIVLIDNLRASSTMVTALAMGIEKIVPVTDDEQVFRVRGAHDLTAGESGGRKIAGYDIGNSPCELAAACQGGSYHTLFIKTSNLVPLLLRFSKALICSSLNLSAVAEYLDNQKACIIPAGGQYGCAEDLGVALALGAKISHAVFDHNKIACFTRESAAARHLAEIGYAKDVEFIVQTDRYDLVPRFDGQKIVRGRP